MLDLVMSPSKPGDNLSSLFIIYAHLLRPLSAVKLELEELPYSQTVGEM